jgi:hypothetical protein
MLSQLRRGEVVDCRERGEEDGGAGRTDRSTGLRTVPAGLITRLVLAEPEAATWGRAAVFHVRGARVSGGLVVRHATFRVPLVFEGCVFEEPVDLSHARVPSLSFQDSVLPALAARGLQLDGELDCSGLRAGTVDLFGARIGGQLWLTGAQVEASTSAWAVNAPGMVVAGGVYCRGLTARGGVNLYGTEVGAAVELDGAMITAADQPAVRAANLIARTDVHLNGTTATGSVDLFGARIGGQLWLNDAHVTASTGQRAVDGPGMVVAGGVYARGLVATGGVNLWGTDIGAALELHGATLTTTVGPALRGPRLSVRGDVTVSDNAIIDGGIDLTAAAVGGSLTLDHAHFNSPGQPTVNLASARLGALRLTAIQGRNVDVDLRRSTVTSLEDDPSCWPQTLRLDGLSYDTLQPHLPARQRLTWLERDPDAGHPQPYQQLANYYRRTGQDQHARTVLLARERQQRKDQRPLTRIWGHLQDVTVGYGYRPVRALAWLLAMVATVAIYTAAHPPHADAATSPGLNPVAYAVDVVLPILDLGQEKAFTPTGPGRWITWLAALAGWILATAVLAAVSRTITRE